MKLERNPRVSFPRSMYVAARFLFTLTLLFFSSMTLAATCTSTRTGNWSSNSTWTGCGGGTPGSGDTAIIANGHTVTADANVTVGAVTVNAGGVLNITRAWTVNGATNVSGTMGFTGTNGNTIFVGMVTINSGGSWSNTVNEAVEFRGGITNNGSWSGGTAAQSFTTNSQVLAGSSPMLFGGGVTIGSSITLTNNNTDIVTINGTLNGSNASSTWVNGVNATLNYGSQTQPMGTGILNAGAAPNLVNYSRAGAQSVKNATYNNLTLSGSGTKTLPGALTIGGNFAMSGTASTTAAGALAINGDFSLGAGTSFNAGSYTHSLGGNFTNSSTSFTQSTSTFVFNGAGAQSISGSSATTFNNLTISNTGNGVSLSRDVAVSTQLSLVSGIVATGSNILTANANCTGSINRSGGFVDGKLRLLFPSGTNIACTYPVGSNGYYAPIDVVMTSTGGLLTGWTTFGAHPSIASSGLNTAKKVNRYWSLYTGGDGITSTNYSATFNFPTADVDSGASWSNFIVAKYAGGAWTSPRPDAVAAVTSTTASNITGGITVATDFAIGEDGTNPCPVTPGFASCVCDNFGRATLNPSTIFGSDWIVNNSGGTFGDPRVVNGYLRLTDNSGNASTAATVPGSFPAAGNNITVEFKYYAYGGTNPGADGIALTLSDANITPAAGAYGGSLGYAQKTGISGFAGGWLGVGIDEFGNFANPTEGRVGGPGVRAQSVTLRGSGSGSGAGTTNYAYLATSSALTPTIDSAGNVTRPTPQMYRITVDATQYTWNGSSGNKTTLVRVERDTSGTGNSYQTLPNLNLTNIYSYNTGQANVPQNWKLSFTGATGGNTNIHEIKGLKVCSTYFTPPGSFDIQANSATGLTCSDFGSTPPPPVVTITARDSQNATNQNYTGAVTLTARRPDGSVSNTVTWRRVGTAGTIGNGGSYTYVAADAGTAQFYLRDTAAETLTITVNDTTTSTTSANGIAFSGNGESFTVEDAEPSVPAVAGRPHLMKVTYYTGCGGPTAVAGSKSMSGWYTRDSADPGGAAPRMCPAPSGPPTSCLPDASPQTCANPQLTTSPPGTSNLTLNFNGSSSAYFCLKSSDVGKYYPYLRDTASPSATTSTSALMTVRPFAVVVSGVKAGTTSNQASTVTASANGGAALTEAGSNFEATVGGYRWSAAADADGDGLPDANTNFAAVTGGGIAPSYAQSVAMAAAAPFAPSGGADGTLSGSPVLVTGGSTTQLTLAYGEVGAFTLTATPAPNYLGSVDLSNRVAIFSNPASGNRNAAVGRFKPYRFAALTPSLTNACGSFTYQGQPFNLGFTLQAQNRAGQRTTKYGLSGYAPVIGNSALGLVAENADSGINLNAANRITPALSFPGAWSNGEHIFPASPYQFTRPPTQPDGPFSALDIGLTVNDTGDGVPLRDMDMNATTAGACGPTGCNAVKLGTLDMRYGRLNIDNAYGSELLALPIKVEAQYWDGSRYVRSTGDNCTPLTSGSYQMKASGYIGGITTGNMTMVGNFQGAGTLNAGVGKIILKKPDPAPTAKGSVLLESQLSYLPGAGRQTFGLYKSGPVIYIRERY